MSGFDLPAKSICGDCAHFGVCQKIPELSVDEWGKTCVLAREGQKKASLFLLNGKLARGRENNAADLLSAPGTEAQMIVDTLRPIVMAEQLIVALNRVDENQKTIERLSDELEAAKQRAGKLLETNNNLMARLAGSKHRRPKPPKRTASERQAALDAHLGSKA